MHPDHQAALGLSDDEVRLLQMGTDAREMVDRCIARVSGLSIESRRKLLEIGKGTRDPELTFVRTILAHNFPVISSPEEDALRAEIRHDLQSGVEVEFIPVDLERVLADSQIQA